MGLYYQGYRCLQRIFEPDRMELYISLRDYPSQFLRPIDQVTGTFYGLGDAIDESICVGQERDVAAQIPSQSPCRIGEFAGLARFLDDSVDERGGFAQHLDATIKAASEQLRAGHGNLVVVPDVVCQNVLQQLRRFSASPLPF